jgi:hypothetical protein
MRASSPRISIGSRHLADQYEAGTNGAITYTPKTARDWNRRDNADLRRARPAYRKAIPGMMSHTRKDITMR